MNKSFVIKLLVIVCLAGCSKKVDKTISLPIEYHEGYGPFIPNWSPLGGERKGDPNKDEWLRIYLPVKNLPKGWSHVKKELVWLDTYQLVYQNFKQGNLSKEFYFDLQKSWDWVPNERNLSATPIKCFVYVIWGVDQNGNWAAMIDSNNNLDFGDERAFSPEVIDPRELESYKKYTKPIIVRCEKVQHGKIVSTHIPMVIKLLGGDFVFNFPRYASAKLNVDGRDFDILISSQNFTSPSFTKTTIARAPAKIRDNNIEGNDLIELNQILDLGNLISTKKYKNLGVDWGNELLFWKELIRILFKISISCKPEICLNHLKQRNFQQEETLP